MPLFTCNISAGLFMGRDIFAPVAAHLSLGTTPAELGKPLDHSKSCRAQVVSGGNQIEGEIIYIDNFGNLFTNIRERDLTGLPKEHLQISLAGSPLGKLVTTYANVGAGEFACVLTVGACLRLLSIKGTCMQRVGAKVGDKVTVGIQE
jgi:S-adenosylmethionine hydrolase